MTIWNWLTVAALVWCALLTVRIYFAALLLDEICALLEKLAGVKWR